MPLVSLLVFSLLGLTIVAVVLAIVNPPRWYSAAALATCIFSFLKGLRKG
jgi:hypothetical protein